MNSGLPRDLSPEKRGSEEQEVVFVFEKDWPLGREGGFVLIGPQVVESTNWDSGPHTWLRSFRDSKLQTRPRYIKSEP